MLCLPCGLGDVPRGVFPDTGVRDVLEAGVEGVWSESENMRPIVLNGF